MGVAAYQNEVAESIYESRKKEPLGRGTSLLVLVTVFGEFVSKTGASRQRQLRCCLVVFVCQQIAAWTGTRWSDNSIQLLAIVQSRRISRAT